MQEKQPWPHLPGSSFRTIFVRTFLWIALLFTTVRSCPAMTETILHSFVSLPQGANPQSNLVADSTGNLYGTTYGGGNYGQGTVFEVTADSGGKWRERVLYTFSGGSDGGNPAAGLIFDGAGNLYGTTSNGGAVGQNGCYYYGCGVVFELSPVGNGDWAESVLWSFAGGNDGNQPLAGLAIDHSGNLFGTTYYGGSDYWGDVFKLTPNGDGTWTESILYTFTDGTDGGGPAASLTFDSSGAIYGTTQYGGNVNCDSYAPKRDIYGCGTVFRLIKNSDNSWSETVLHSFLITDGGFPVANVIFDSAGSLYGTTASGPGLCGCGTVFRLSPNSDGSWTHTMLYNFEGGPDGRTPVAGLIFGNEGRIYGTTMLGGGSPYCGGGEACGTVFELSQNKGGAWREKVIFRFAAESANSGADPVAGLLMDRAGNLYGTTAGGGISVAYCYQPGYTEGCGTVFRLTPASGGRWVLDTITSFALGKYGFAPMGGVISDGSGNLYTTTYAGGTAYCDGDTTGVVGCGTVYELQMQAEGVWKGVTLHQFNGLEDGAGPEGSLLADASGNLYGTTSYGGSANCMAGASPCGGTVFELSPTSHGWRETVLHDFKPDGSGGSSPQSGLTMDSAGNLYGTTPYGGPRGFGCTWGCGTVFKLSPAKDGHWTEEVLHVFTGRINGANPQGSLALDENGAVYGATCGGGGYGNGTVFKLIPQAAGAWQEDILYSFQGAGDRSCPLGGVIMDNAGNLYGTTDDGGSGYGVVFELSPSGRTSWTETVLLAFQITDGAYPRSGLTMDGAGNLYAAVALGGESYNCCGVVTELSPGSNGWTEQVLHTFTGAPDGNYPSGTVFLDGLGDIYGTTLEGGNDSTGVIFELSPGGFEGSPFAASRSGIAATNAQSARRSDSHFRGPSYLLRQIDRGGR